MSNPKEVLNWTIKIIIIQVWTMSQKSIKYVPIKLNVFLTVHHELTIY